VEGASFLLQDFYVEALAHNLMMHLLVEDVDAWWSRVRAADLAGKYGVKVGDIALQPWRMRDFVPDRSQRCSLAHRAERLATC
jgi:hypothetical protein